MAGIELRSVGNGLEWLEVHGESALLARSAAVQYYRSITRQTAHVIRPSRHLHVQMIQTLNVKRAISVITTEPEPLMAVARWHRGKQHWYDTYKLY